MARTTKKTITRSKDKAVLVNYYKTEVAAAKAALKLAESRLTKAKLARAMEVACW